MKWKRIRNGMDRFSIPRLNDERSHIQKEVQKSLKIEWNRSVLFSLHRNDSRRFQIIHFVMAMKTIQCKRKVKTAWFRTVSIWKRYNVNGAEGKKKCNCNERIILCFMTFSKQTWFLEQSLTDSFDLDYLEKFWIDQEDSTSREWRHIWRAFKFRSKTNHCFDFFWYS